MGRTLRSILYRLLQYNWIRNALIVLPFFRKIHSGAHLTHPIDRQYGIDTSGFYPGDLVATDPARAGEVNAYLGSPPDLLRRILAQLHDLSAYSFVDFGCGKGRALAVASEFPFKALIGIELSPAIAAIARRNTRIIARRHPDRKSIVIRQGDATLCTPPDGKLVAFCYNPFRRDMTGDLVRLLERHGATGADVIFIYINPEWAELVDASPVFRRMASFAAGETGPASGHGLSRHDFTALLWRSVQP